MLNKNEIKEMLSRDNHPYVSALSEHIFECENKFIACMFDNILSNKEEKNRIESQGKLTLDLEYYYEGIIDTYKSVLDYFKQEICA